jgi:glycosyltransferase involved in cell wall biosynthesis
VKVIICLNTAWNLVNFRAGLIRALVAQGYEVVAVAPHDAYADRLAALGCRFVPLPMDNRGTHPGRDGLLLWRFWRLLRQERPDVYLGYTVKPNVYGSLAAHWLGIPVINNIAGLGAVFIQDGWLVRVVRGLYRLALGCSAKVFFQNDDDRQMFVAGGLVRDEVAALLPGSGIDLTRFVVAPMPVIASEARQSTKSGDMDCHGADAPRNDGHKFRFLLIARMLWDKGVGEYVEAAQLLRQRWPQAEFCLLGFVDVQNPAAISRTQMDTWVAQGHVSYLGVSDDVRTHIAQADCVVLPSYREGTPRTLLEAAAMGLPIITTDAVGCREVVQDGHNGLLCQPRNAIDLAQKMERMLRLTPAQRAVMGINGRKKMEAEFDEQIVIDRYLAAVREVVGQQPGLPRR